MEKITFSKSRAHWIQRPQPKTTPEKHYLDMYQAIFPSFFSLFLHNITLAKENGLRRVSYPYVYTPNY